MAFRETQDHIMNNMCAKFHQNPCINLGGVGGTFVSTDGQTDILMPVYPHNFIAWDIKCRTFDIVSHEGSKTRHKLYNHLIYSVKDLLL
jgi:hypothetical protein